MRCVHTGASCTVKPLFKVDPMDQGVEACRRGGPFRWLPRSVHGVICTSLFFSPARQGANLFCTSVVGRVCGGDWRGDDGPLLHTCLAGGQRRGGSPWTDGERACWWCGVGCCCGGDGGGGARCRMQPGMEGSAPILVSGLSKDRRWGGAGTLATRTHARSVRCGWPQMRASKVSDRRRTGLLLLV